MLRASCFTAGPGKAPLKLATSSHLRTSASPRSIWQTILIVGNEGPQGGLGSTETTAPSCAPASWRAAAAAVSWRAVSWALWKRPASSLPGLTAWSLGFQQWMLDPNQAINETSYCSTPPHSSSGWRQNCTMSRVKHTHLALTSGGGSFHLWGQDHGYSPLEGGCSAGQHRRL